jgi:hypothetical protein
MALARLAHDMASNPDEIVKSLNQNQDHASGSHCE